MSSQTPNFQELYANEQKKCKLLEKKLDRLEAEAKQAKDQAADQAGRIDELEVESELKDAQIETIQKALDHVDRPVVSGDNDMIKEQQAKIEMLKARIMDLEKEKEGLSEANERLQGSSQGIHQELTKPVAHVDDYVGGVNQRQRQDILETLTAMVKGDGITRGKLMACRDRTKRKVDQLEDELRSVSKVQNVQEPQSSASQNPPPPSKKPVCFLKVQHDGQRSKTSSEAAPEENLLEAFTAPTKKNLASAPQGPQQASPEQSLASENACSPDSAQAPAPAPARTQNQRSSSNFGLLTNKESIGQLELLRLKGRHTLHRLP